MEQLLPSFCSKVVSSRSQIECCKFSPSGDTLAACFSDGSVRLYGITLSSSSGSIAVELKHHFKEHKSNVWCMSFSSDGFYLSSCSSDKTAIIYSLSTMGVKHVLRFHSQTVWCCVFSKQSLATSSQDRTVNIYNHNQDTCDLIHTLKNFHSPVIDLSFNSQGDKLCTCTCNGDIEVWLINTLQSNTSPFGLLVHSNVSPRICKFITLDDTDYIVHSSDDDHSFTMLDIRESIEQSILTDADGGLVSSVDRSDGCMDVRSLVRCFRKFNGHCNIVWSFCCLATQTEVLLVTCSGDRTIRCMYVACTIIIYSWLCGKLFYADILELYSLGIAAAID